MKHFLAAAAGATLAALSGAAFAQMYQPVQPAPPIQSDPEAVQPMQAPQPAPMYQPVQLAPPMQPAPQAIQPMQPPQPAPMQGQMPMMQPTTISGTPTWMQDDGSSSDHPTPMPGDVSGEQLNSRYLNGVAVPPGTGLPAQPGQQ